MTTPTPFLFSPPPKYVLPLAKGGDLAVQFLNDPNDDGNYVDYGVGVTVTLHIDSIPAVSQAATISGHTATVKVESDVADTIDGGIPWRLILSTPTSPSTEVVAAYGKTKRFDA
jgi:hypothetical protein